MQCDVLFSHLGEKTYDRKKIAFVGYEKGKQSIFVNILVITMKKSVCARIVLPILLLLDVTKILSLNAA